MEDCLDDSDCDQNYSPSQSSSSGTEVESGSESVDELEADQQTSVSHLPNKGQHALSFILI